MCSWSDLGLAGRSVHHTQFVLCLLFVNCHDPSLVRILFSFVPSISLLRWRPSRALNLLHCFRNFKDSRRPSLILWSKITTDPYLECVFVKKTLCNRKELSFSDQSCCWLAVPTACFSLLSTRVRMDWEGPPLHQQLWGVTGQQVWLPTKFVFVF